MKETSQSNQNNEIPGKVALPKYSQRFKDLMSKTQPPSQTLAQSVSPTPTTEHNQNEDCYATLQPCRTAEEEIPVKSSALETEYFFYRVKSIGVGAHSFVYLIQEQSTKCLYAQKAIAKTHAAQNQKQLLNQIKIQYRLNHDNLISLYHFYADENYIYLIMEYAEQSLFNLKNKFKKFKEKQVIQILRQSLHALSFMHRQGFVHADIKIQNLMIRNGRVKLCDFGYAVKFEGERKIQSDQIVGTLQYLSPEYVQGIDSGPMRDIWALGILCFQLWTGKNPFQDLKQNEKWLKLVKPDYQQFLNQLQSINVKQKRKSLKIQTFIKKTLCPIQKRQKASKLLGLDFFNSVLVNNGSAAENENDNSQSHSDRSHQSDSSTTSQN